jgi:hypothetical protein
MMISGVEQSSILSGQGNNANVIREIPNGQQTMPTPIMKNKENNAPLSP